ncbi:hypothetical protein M231_04284 [Tremella mesenterica]|uniref:Major facilitator superfamily (MFS) profile domain-containing protein n=1 Tax=Tremella mesenterica TaxID=5217 RepID=A0A4Q1BKS9_TREME|nr:hypothetical protein M231_04284 [Tremella mesenterica]
MKGKGKWHGVTPYMFFCCCVFACGNILYGLDVSSFGAIQTLPSWLRQFGELQPDGTYILQTRRQSIMNGVVWPGKITGVLLFDPILNRLGYKRTAILVACIQSLALIIELTAKDWRQYCVGRVFAYLGVGIVENIVPAYHAELAPAEIRGFFAGSIQVLVHIGAIWASSVTKAYATEPGNIGWLVPTAQQLIPGVLLMIFVPLTVESPRWLLLHKKEDRALKNLNRIRPKKDVDSGLTMLEIDALEQANFESRANESRWIELFQGTYRRRAVITAVTFFLNEVTGQQYTNAFGPTFYKSIGLGAKTFTYNILVTLAGFVACVIAIFSNDRIGRVPLVVLSCGLCIIFTCLVGSLGAIKSPTTTQQNTVIASIILINFSAKIGVSSQCYTIGAELGGTRMRKKMMAVGTAVDVIAAFLVTFCTPYIQNASGANLGARTAYIWMGFAILGLCYFPFFLPELKGRSLEEVDDLFEQRLWAWQFRHATTSGVGARIHRLEQGVIEGKEEFHSEHVENVESDKV